MGKASRGKPLESLGNKAWTESDVESASFSIAAASSASLSSHKHFGGPKHSSMSVKIGSIECWFIYYNMPLSFSIVLILPFRQSEATKNNV